MSSVSLIDRNAWAWMLAGMLAGVDPTPGAPAETNDGQRTTGERPSGGYGDRPRAHLLAYNSPEAPPNATGWGWTLITRHGPRWSVSRPLAARGADTHTATRTAQAVAARVLAEHGRTVEGWTPEPVPDAHADSKPGEQTGNPLVFRARLRLPAPWRARGRSLPAARGPRQCGCQRPEQGALSEDPTHGRDSFR